MKALQDKIDELVEVSQKRYEIYSEDIEKCAEQAKQEYKVIKESNNE